MSVFYAVSKKEFFFIRRLLTFNSDLTGLCSSFGSCTEDAFYIIRFEGVCVTFSPVIGVVVVEIAITVFHRVRPIVGAVTSALLVMPFFREGDCDSIVEDVPIGMVVSTNVVTRTTVPGH